MLIARVSEVPRRDLALWEDYQVTREGYAVVGIGQLSLRSGSMSEYGRYVKSHRGLRRAIPSLV